MFNTQKDFELDNLNNFFSPYVYSFARCIRAYIIEYKVPL